MLEVESGRVAERVVVDRRDVPEPVNAEPGDEGDERMCRRAHDAIARERRRHAGAQPGDGQRRRPLRHDDVLDEVGGEQVVERDRRKRRDGDEQQQDDGDCERRDACAARPVAAGGGGVDARESERERDFRPSGVPTRRGVVHA